jgi:type IV secretory pathway VirB2 component (pilin)
MKQFKEKALVAGKTVAPLAVCLGMSAISCFAGQSPFGRWMQDLRMEATGTWAIAGAVLGLIVGLLGMLFGDHSGKGKFAWTAGVSFALLSVEGIVAYLQSEG